MIIKNRSILSGNVTEMEIPITREQLERWLRREDLIQRIMPEITREQREFLLSGMTIEEQRRFFGR